MRSVFQINIFMPLHRQGSIIIKSIAVLLPVLQVSLLRANILQSSIPAFFTVANIILGTSAIVGSIALIAILVKYIITRRAFLSWNVHYGQKSSATNNTVGTLADEQLIPLQRSIYDRWLVIRFAIAFLALR